MKKLFQIINPYTAILCIVLLCYFSSAPLFHSGFFPIHDDEQIARLYEMFTVVTQGQIPPRWIPDLGFGYGFPLFNFYPPFVYYLGVIFHISGFSLIQSTKIVIIAGFLLSAIGMYFWVENRLGKLAGVIASVLYVYVPYHAVDIYVRGALSEFFSFVWVPFLFWSLDKLSTNRNSKWTLIASFMLMGLLLTHSLVALQVVPFLFFYMLFLLYEQKKNFWRLFISFGVVMIITLGATAYFWMPFILEKGYTLVDTILTRELANYALHFVCPQQLWSSPWGYGGSAPGCVDGLSFQVGKVQAVLALLGSIISIIIVFRKRYFPLSLLCSLLLLFSLYLTTDYSLWIWKAIQPLSYIQFPWRFLLLVAVFSAYLSGVSISYMQRYIGKYSTVLVVGIFISFALFQVRHDFAPQSYNTKTDKDYTSKEDLQWRVSRMSYEYVPKGVQTTYSPQHTTILAITHADLPQTTYDVISGRMNITEDLNLADDKTYTVDTTVPGILQINTFSFPGWVVFVDKKVVDYHDNNRLKLIQIPLTLGRHSIEVRFENTLVRLIGNTISLLTILILGAFIVGKLIYFRYNK